jgi:hypothetical protein
MQILNQVLHMLKNRERKKITFIHINASLQCFSLKTPKCQSCHAVKYGISDSILNISRKKSQIHVFGTDTDLDSRK